MNRVPVAVVSSADTDTAGTRVATRSRTEANRPLRDRIMERAPSPSIGWSSGATVRCGFAIVSPDQHRYERPENEHRAERNGRSETDLPHRHEPDEDCRKSHAGDEHA